jgi:hypothetical protein
MMLYLSSIMETLPVRYTRYVYFVAYMEEGMCTMCANGQGATSTARRLVSLQEFMEARDRQIYRQ